MRLIFADKLFLTTKERIQKIWHVSMS